MKLTRRQLRNMIRTSLNEQSNDNPKGTRSKSGGKYSPANCKSGVAHKEIPKEAVTRLDAILNNSIPAIRGNPKGTGIKTLERLAGTAWNESGTTGSLKEIHRCLWAWHMGAKERGAHDSGGATAGSTTLGKYAYEEPHKPQIAGLDQTSLMKTLTDMGLLDALDAVIEQEGLKAKFKDTMVIKLKNRLWTWHLQSTQEGQSSHRIRTFDPVSGKGAPGEATPGHPTDRYAGEEKHSGEVSSAWVDWGN
jgi:hypothetical protein